MFGRSSEGFGTRDDRGGGPGIDAGAPQVRDTEPGRATDSGGPTTLAGTATSATTLGGLAARSMMATVSGGALAMTLGTPSTSITLLSFAETASWAWATGTTASTTNESARNHGAVVAITSAWIRAALAKKVPWSSASGRPSRYTPDAEADPTGGHA